MTTRTAADILAELTEFRAARVALIKGERAQEVSKDGRSVKFTATSMTDLNTAILSLEREYESALAGENGRPRRRPIYLGYRN